jgi:hypothetical protein
MGGEVIHEAKNRAPVHFVYLLVQHNYPRPVILRGRVPAGKRSRSRLEKPCSGISTEIRRFKRDPFKLIVSACSYEEFVVNLEQNLKYKMLPVAKE